MILTIQELGTPAVFKIKEYLNQRIQTLRALNDGELDENKTATMRGRIAESKAMLAMITDEPIIK